MTAGQGEITAARKRALREAAAVAYERHAALLKATHTSEFPALEMQLARQAHSIGDAIRRLEKSA